MKKLISIAAACGVLCTLNSCGTIGSLVTKGKRPVFMMRAPSDLQVSCGGERLALKRDQFATSESSSIATNTRTVTSYYATSVRMPFKENKTLELYSPSQNKKATVTVKSKGSGAIIVGDLLISGPVGIILDVATKNHRVFKPKYVDVQAALDNTKWKSQGQLKRAAKKGK